MFNSRNIMSPHTRYLAGLLVALSISLGVFAVDGIVMKSKSNKNSFSNMKKNLTLSLREGFYYKDNKSFGYRKNGGISAFNSVITYQKGNVTYIMPYRNKVILNKFKTPQKPQH